MVAGVQGTLFQWEKQVKETSDVYVLPPPEQVAVLSLGYRSAVADVLWAHVLVSQGLHTQEKRRFENLTLLYDAINELDPTFREPYRMADALITFQANETPHHEIVKAREILERGTQNLPLDSELWLIKGHFVGFIAPSSYLTDEGEKASWRLDGARAMVRAVELGGDNASISWQAYGGAGIFRKAGERDAERRFLRRTLAVTDEPELRERIQRRLDAIEGEEHRAREKRRDAAFMEMWRRDLPFVSKSAIFVLGPPRDPAYCAGPARFGVMGCAATWREWSESFGAAEER